MRKELKLPPTRIVLILRQELLSSSKAGKGSMVIVRAHSSILAEKFYDTLIQTRDKLNLCQVFEVRRSAWTVNYLTLSSLVCVCQKPYFDDLARGLTKSRLNASKRFQVAAVRPAVHMQISALLFVRKAFDRFCPFSPCLKPVCSSESIVCF